MPGKNVLWCSTFQLVWNEGCRYAGGDIHLKDEPPMVAALNKKIGNEKDVDAASCLVMSGLVEDGVVKKIRRELDQKFQGQADPDLLDGIEPNLPTEGWLAYAYLFRELPFEYPFKRFEEPLMFGSSRVASFGLRKLTGRMDDIHKAQQVIILGLQGRRRFRLQLKPKDKNERIVLAKIPRPRRCGRPSRRSGRASHRTKSRRRSSRWMRMSRLLFPSSISTCGKI